ncbi:hypothetical protein PLEOSDRAFT_1082652 [Pleurotus ostreatus PC15]|uniref:Uncharacterized protein n=1 Tax=Pleurotus ostreatus (strain PC15) TaxID=1137138 RepID=A0A067NNN5_PLEO1|nr:hypothetical protein PLEOSDRAFT_1082652 [Pleurotus ostreatus PC15]
MPGIRNNHRGRAFKLKRWILRSSVGITSFWITNNFSLRDGICSFYQTLGGTFKLIGLQTYQAPTFQMTSWGLNIFKQVCNEDKKCRMHEVESRRSAYRRPSSLGTSETPTNLHIVLAKRRPDQEVNMKVHAPSKWERIRLPVPLQHAKILKVLA